MNKREAKRRAYYLVGAWAEDAIDMGFESLYEGEDGEPLSSSDSERVEAAVREVAASLLRRYGQLRS